MLLLIIYLSIALIISFVCSVLESVLLSIPDTYAAMIMKKNRKLSENLSLLKNNIDRPIAAILSLNTIAHTIGAAGVGAQAMQVFGEAYLAIISAILTILILVFSEIIPKTLGVVHWKRLVGISVFILKYLIIILYPFVRSSESITKIIAGKRDKKSLNRDELKALLEIGLKEGAILEKESEMLKNLLKSYSIKVKEISTPRTVMFVLQQNLSLKEIIDNQTNLNFSRIPIYSKNVDDLKYYVRKDEILQAALNGKLDSSLYDLKRELLIVPDNISLFALFDKLLIEGEYIALTVDEFGGVSGLVTLEDIVESIIGVEIIDETDIVEDMQKLAKDKWISQLGE